MRSFIGGLLKLNRKNSVEFWTSEIAEIGIFQNRESLLRNFSDTAEERVPQTLVRTGAALWPEWQTGLLSFTLRITGVVDLLAAVIVTLFLGVLRTEFAVIAVVGAILLLFSRFGYRFPRTTSIGYLHFRHMSG